MIKLIECPRDAMQGLKKFIPTSAKADYINSLLKVGFDTIDFGSFVSPKAIPQLKDTAEVLKLIDLSDTKTKLLAIIGNLRGATEAAKYEQITYLGFPFSISNTFLNLNIKSSHTKALADIAEIQKLAVAKNKILVVYLSMAFGNPYGDAYGLEIILNAIEELKQLGIKIINLADTVGVGVADDIGLIYAKASAQFPDIEIGLHLHTTADSFYTKIDEAYKNGCMRFDSVMLGLGGCPMSEQKLIGNLSTENLISYFSHNNIDIDLDFDKYRLAQQKARKLFPI